MKCLSFIITFFAGLQLVSAIDIHPNFVRIEKFVNEQGLYQNTVNAIATDKNNLIWLGTPNGLIKHDGYSFEYFYHHESDSNSIPNNHITHIQKDVNGDLWIITKGGLCLYKTDEERFITPKTDFGVPFFIKEDSEKNIWVASKNKLYIFQPSNQENFKNIGFVNYKKYTDRRRINDLVFISNSEFIVTTNSSLYRGKYQLNNIKELHMTSMSLSKENIGVITSILKTENSLWIGTNKGIYQTFYEGEKLTIVKSFFASDESDYALNITSLFKDQNNNIWIGSLKKGVYRYNRKTASFTSFKDNSNHKYGLSSNYIQCIHEDQFGVMWIGTKKGGVNKIDTHQKPFYNFSLSNKLVTSIAQNKNGEVWLSCLGKDIMKTNTSLVLEEDKNSQFKEVSDELKLLNRYWILKLYEDSKNHLWIGAKKGRSYIYDIKKDRLERVLLEVNNDTISPFSNSIFYELGEDKILIAGQRVFILDNPYQDIFQKKIVKVEKDLFEIGSNHKVNDFYKDQQGNFWFATTNGLFLLQQENNEFGVKAHYTTQAKNEKLQLSHNNISSLYFSDKQTLWLTTLGGGIMRLTLDEHYECSELKTYKTGDGLSSNIVYGMMEDDEKNLWMSTYMGISKLVPKTERFIVFDKNDGLSNFTFIESAYLKTAEGKMLMGGAKGLTIFDPEKIKKNTILPEIILSGLKINHNSIKVGEKYDDEILLNESIATTDKIVLNSDQKNLSLDIIVQHSSTPQKNRLKYKLEGINDSWVNVAHGKTTITYTNLDAGTYTLYYQGVNLDGIWSDEVKELKIVVLAPWYLRWWSILLFGVVITTIIYLLIDYLIYNNKLKERLQYEQKDKERVEEIHQSRLQFFTNISHDFKTPLSLIIGPLEKIAENHNLPEDQKYLKIINNNIARLQNLIEQLISYRKAETGHLELKITETTLGDFIYPLLDSFEAHAKHTNFNFFHKVNYPNRNIKIDLVKTERIIMNLFSNAIRFIDDDGEINVEAGFEEVDNIECVFFKVSDTGCGIPPEKMEAIFDRFYHGIDSRGEWSGTGIGLALSKSLIDLMKGKIQVESTPFDKTVFKITIPTGTALEVNHVPSEKSIKYRKIVTDWLPDEVELNTPQGDNNLLPKLLIVDDEQDILTFLQESFKNKYEIFLASDGLEAYKKLKDISPQLVISDVMMPDMDGYELCDKIKSDSDTSHIPVILLTALDQNSQKIDGIEVGADDYITKPFSIKHLEIRVHKLLENKKHILEYFSKNSSIPEDTLEMSIRDRKFLENTVNVIEKNMSNSAFGVEELARELGMSTSHFYRKLKKITGQSPNVYLRNFRLRKAANLLTADNEMSAVEVMEQIGIESPSYYSTSFKKLHGVRPSDFVRKMKVSKE
ncbi:hybrid sensor histidine kinase/response regulator transcription factor [Flammeovirga pacifica]|nr:hybrid sensor histidine kinase/response regulator transcription factor [Flammeovirga pacifica]